MSNGWISLHRSMIEWEWYTDSNTMRLFVHLLLIANHSEKKYKGKVIKRGQLITGREKLAKELVLSVQSIRTSLNKLKSTNEITIKPTNKGTLINIVNYSLYQGDARENNQQNNQQANQPLTNHQPASNQQVTTNNNDNNKKNENKERKSTKTKINPWERKGTNKIHDFVYLKTEEYNKLVSDYGKGLTDDTIFEFDSYITNPKNREKYTDHNKALHVWIKREIQRNPELAPKPKKENQKIDKDFTISLAQLKDIRNGDM